MTNGTHPLSFVTDIPVTVDKIMAVTVMILPVGTSRLLN